jgi:aquaporin Z
MGSTRGHFMKYCNEFIGTFFLVLTVGMTVLPPHSAMDLAPLAIGSVLAVMIYAGGHISGAHYNPAVSLAVFMRGKLSGLDLVGYWMSQTLGALLAAPLVIYFKGMPAPDPMNLNVVAALLAEFVFTFALCHVVLNTATTKATANNSYFGWAIGFVVLVGAYSVGAISGAAFNPAVALGMTILNISSWSNLWIYLVANLLGGAFAAIIYRATHPAEMA